MDFAAQPRLSPYSYYRDRVQPLWPIVQNIHERGMRIDTSKRDELRNEAIRIIEETNARLEKALGYIPNTRSWKDWETTYKKLNIQFETTLTGRPSSKEPTLLHYAQKYPEARAILLDTLEVTGQRVLLSQFLNPALDEDSFYHPLLVLNGTATGRFAGKGALEGGPQPQNWPKPIRKMVIPDSSEMILIQADLKQAEAMLVAWDAGDPLLIETFLARKDIHSVRGCVLFREWIKEIVPPDDLIKSIRRVCDDCASSVTDCPHGERQIAKVVGHASNYKLGPRKLANEVLPKAGIFITEGTAKSYQSILISKYVRAWWDATKKELRRSPILYNGAGRFREFYGILDDALLRDVLSWKAQSVVGDITNRAMLEAFDLFERNPRWEARLVTQTHDSILVCCLESAKDEVDNALKLAFDHRLNYHGRDLTIPIDLAHGYSWGDLH